VNGWQFEVSRALVLNVFVTLWQKIDVRVHSRVNRFRGVKLQYYSVAGLFKFVYKPRANDRLKRRISIAYFGQLKPCQHLVFFFR